MQAIHGDPLMRVSSDMPDDVIVLHDALQKIREIYGVPDVNTKGLQWGERSARRSAILSDEVASRASLSISVKNCGTALRFLEVHLEKCYPGEPITLTGDARLMERKGKPTSQTTSARILHGENIPKEENESPYITMTRKVMDEWMNGEWMNGEGVNGIEKDWSAAAFWYEYVAIHGGELLLEGLTDKSIQGDRVVADIYAKYFGVTTTFTQEGAVVKSEGVKELKSERIEIDFTNCPDLYPAIALTCEKLCLPLEATGTERLQYKESDRLEAVRLHEVRDDHRMAMALMASGEWPTPNPSLKGGENSLERIIAKSYPQFIDQFYSLLSGRAGVGCSHITPIKGVNDDNLGKKHALSKLIHAATSEYVWLHDDDVVLPKAAKEPILTFPKGKENLDLIILPLRMESSPSLSGEGRGEASSLLERLQIAEYAAIQELTMRMAKKEQAIMCSGANLIVKREVWLACESELHPEIPSGDDMFLLEAAKRHGYKIGVIDEEDYTAVVRPITSWKAFFKQRMRWAGKAPKYTDKDIRRYGMIVVAANILQLLCLLIILIKFPIEYSLIKKREPRTPWYVAFLLELVYPIYMLVAFLGGLLRTKQW